MRNGLHVSGGGSLISGYPKRIALSGKLNFIQRAKLLLDNTDGLNIIMSSTKKYKDFIEVWHAWIYPIYVWIAFYERLGVIQCRTLITA